MKKEKETMLKDITAGHTSGDVANSYHASIFNDNKFSDKAREMIKPIRAAETSLRHNLVNRLNHILYNRPEPLPLQFNKRFLVRIRYEMYDVVSVTCRHAVKYIGGKDDARKLFIRVTSKSGVESNYDVLAFLSTDDLFKLYEAVVRALYPAEDDPDNPEYKIYWK